MSVDFKTNNILPDYFDSISDFLQIFRIMHSLRIKQWFIKINDILLSDNNFIL